jgi:hypothetical protein
MSALDGLDAIPWKRLRHAYGAAQDVPAMLGNVASADVSKRKEGWRGLQSALYHQGTRYSASAAAVPFLIALARRARTRERHRILAYLVDLAWGFPDEYLADPFEPLDWRKAPGALRKTHFAVRDGAPVYLALLDDDDADVRCAAAYAAPWFQATASEAAEALGRRLARERSSKVKLSLILGVGMAAGRARRAEDAGLLARFVAARDAAARAAAACGLGWIQQAAAPAPVLQALREAVTDAGLRRTPLPWNGGDLAGVAGKLLVRLAQPDDRDSVLAVARAVRELSDPHQALHGAISLLQLLRLPARPPRPLRPDDITEVQREALALLIEGAAAFHYANIREHLEYYGLPHRSAEGQVPSDNGRDALRRFIS